VRCCGGARVGEGDGDGIRNGGGLDWAAGFGSGVTPVATAGVAVGAAGPFSASRAMLTPKKSAITPTTSTAPRISV
jgi:hypothetical protein